MKEETRTKLLSLLLAPYDALLFFPLYVFFCNAFGQSLPLACALALAASLGARVCGLLLGRRRLVGGAPLCAAVMAAGWLLLGGRAVGLVFFCLTSAALFLYALRISVLPLDEAYTPLRLLPAAGFYLVVPVMMYLAHVDGAALLGYGGAVYIAASLAVYSMRSIAINASMRMGPPKAVVRRNALLLAVMLTAFIALVCFSALREGAGALLFSTLSSLLNKSPSLQPDELPINFDSHGGGGGMDMSAYGTALESPFWQVLQEVLFRYIAPVLLPAIAVAVIFIVVRKIVRALRSGAAWMASSYSDGYVERSESLLGVDTADREASPALERLRRMLTPPPRWDRLSPRARVRLAYRSLVRRAGDVGVDASTLTPAELLANKRVSVPGDPARFLDAYCLVRYADREPTEAQQDVARAVYRGK